jgi:hypothetical protein
LPREPGSASIFSSISKENTALLPNTGLNLEFRLSYGTGRPAILKDDESIAHCRLILRHPLAIEDDMRLVSTVELMALRERLNSHMSSVHEPVRDQDFEELRRAAAEFRTWFATWDQAFSQKYEDAGKISIFALIFFFWSEG